MDKKWNVSIFKESTGELLSKESVNKVAEYLQSVIPLLPDNDLISIWMEAQKLKVFWGMAFTVKSLDLQVQISRKG